MRLLMVCVLFVMCVWSNAQAKDKVAVSLKLQWLDQFQFAGYYMAKEKGFYKDAGIDLTIVPYTFEGQDVVSAVMKGDVDFGTGRSSLLADRIHGKKVVALAAIFQDAPMILMMRKDSGITEPTDLIGRKVMVSPDALSAAPIMGMLSAVGVRPFDIIRQKHSYNIDDLISGKTDAMACYISNEPYILQERGVEFVSFVPKDYGQFYYGDLLFTSEKMIAKNPKLVADFREASLKGWAYAFDNIEETAKLIKSKYDGQKKSLQSLIFEGEELKKLAYQNGLGLGHIGEKKFKSIGKLYHEMGVFPDDYSLDGFIWKP